MKTIQRRWRHALIAALVFFFAFALLAGDEPPETPPPGKEKNTTEEYKRKTTETQYLVFMPSRSMFKGKGMKGNLDTAIKTIIDRIGTTGDKKHRLAFALPLPTWRKIPKEQFDEILVEGVDVAIKRDIGIYFFVESLEWKDRPDLWNYNQKNKPGYDPENKKNVEWTDWDGTPFPHRYRDWGTPEKMEPVICYNSPKVLEEISRMVKKKVIPRFELVMKKLKKAKKEYLFAGITVGAEQMLPDYSVIDKINPKIARMMEKDKTPKARLGYNALTNKGFSKKKPPKDFAKALAEINQEYVAYWCKQLKEAGVPKNKMYTHIAAAAGCPGTKMLEYSKAPNRIAFNKYSRPGWTTYAAGPLKKNFKLLYEELKKHGNPRWGGTECNPNFGSVVHPEAYLSRHFDYGATVMVMNVGATSAGLTSRLERGVWGEESIEAYKRFLTGKPLRANLGTKPGKEDKEKPSPDKMKETRERIQGKVRKIQQGIRAWHREGKDPSAIGEMMKEFDKLIRSNKIKEAEKLLDKALKLLGA